MWTALDGGNVAVSACDGLVTRRFKFTSLVGRYGQTLKLLHLVLHAHSIQEASFQTGLPAQNM